MPQILSTISEQLTNTAPQTQYWDYVNKCMNIVMHSDGVNLSVGEEEYFPLVLNSTGSTITNGTLVGFGEIDGGLKVVPYIADGSFAPWYIAGVATQDIASGSTGRITKFGYLRNLNTTGSLVSEVWSPGDILYASSTSAGKLTRVKPTAPNVVIPVAVVRTADATEGILLVRVTPQPRLYYGVFLDNTTQTAAVDTPTAITFDTTDIASGFTRGSTNWVDTLGNSWATPGGDLWIAPYGDSANIYAANSGLYNFQFSLQLRSSTSAARSVFIWPRVNGVDVLNSCSEWTIKSNSEAYVPSWNFLLSLAAGQYFQLMWTADGAGVTISHTAAITSPYARPAIPSIILTVTQANQ